MEPSDRVVRSGEFQVCVGSVTSLPTPFGIATMNSWFDTAGLEEQDASRRIRRQPGGENTPCRPGADDDVVISPAYLDSQIVCSAMTVFCHDVLGGAAAVTRRSRNEPHGGWPIVRMLAPGMFQRNGKGGGL